MNRRTRLSEQLFRLPRGWDAPTLRQPSWVAPSQILTTFQASHGWTNNAGSTLTTDSTAGTYILGSQSAKIVTGGAGTTATLSKLAMTSFDTTGKMIRLRFRVSNLANLAEIGCFLGSSSLAANYKWSIQVTGSSKFIQDGEWVVVTLSFHDATVTGSPSRSALTDARLFVIDNNTGQAVTVNWQSFELIPDGSSTWANGVISVCFDDSYATQLLGKATMDLYGFPATAFTITDYVGTASRLTLTDLKQAHDYCGWEIAGHANTGVNHSLSYTGMSAQALEADIVAQHAWLMGNGFRGADGAAYPLGQFGLTTDGKSTVDTLRPHLGYIRTTHSRTKETFPPADRYRLRALSGISSFSGAITPASLTTATTGEIDKCKANKSWLILVFHDILSSGSPASSSQITKTDFDSIISAINTAGVPVRTIRDVLRS